MALSSRLGSSFRDPAGFIFEREGRILRQVSASYEPVLRQLHESGLYEELTSEGLLIPHREVPSDEPGTLLEPDRVQTISYPYEWCFGQVQDAALATLEIHRRAVHRQMILKDASAYNIQFHEGKPTLIDTLSFERYEEGKPWIAYRQFCEHFLAPLALIALVDVRLARLSSSYIDGIPIDLVSSLLPGKTRFSPGLAMHVHLHAKSQQQQQGPSASKGSASFGKAAMLGLIDSLRSTIEALSWKPKGSVWGDYYENTNYSDAAMADKRAAVSELLREANPRLLWDLGANTGAFSSLASAAGVHTVAWDLDPVAVEKNYRARRGDPRMLPLVIDLTNPSPSLGWAHSERDSLTKRANPDAVMALALVHHLAIGNNVPLQEVARFFSSLGRHLIIEFVPKSDSQVQRLLATREDVYSDYHLNGFEEAFGRYFGIQRRRPVSGADRTLYLMERK
jgi:hypothetical protein